MLFRKSKWRAACRPDAVGGETPLSVKLDGTPVVLWRDGEGRLAAFYDRCVHMPLPISTGRCTRAGLLRCKYHGVEYDADGDVVGVFGHAVDDPRKAFVFRTVERRGTVWLWLGKAEEADESLLPHPLVQTLIRLWRDREADV